MSDQPFSSSKSHAQVRSMSFLYDNIDPAKSAAKSRRAAANRSKLSVVKEAQKAAREKAVQKKAAQKKAAKKQAEKQAEEKRLEEKRDEARKEEELREERWLEDAGQSWAEGEAFDVTV